jgi:hypothetical protein
LKNYKAVNGIASNEINGLAKHNDSLWVATSAGLTVFSERNISTSVVRPPVYVTGIKVNNQDTALRERYVLPSVSNNIKIDFVGISYRSAGMTKYNYKMDGIDPEWNTTGYRSVQYPSLPPGDYAFSVYAVAADGIRSLQPATVHFTVFPPWYRTWWFVLGSIIVSGSLVTFLIYRRLRQIRLREGEKTELNRRAADMELKALRAQMNPHFIFNAMNSIQNFIIRNESESAHRYLSKFSKLIRNVLDNSKNKLVPLEQELETLELYLELESLRFEHKFTYAFIIDPSIDMNFAEIPSMLIQPYVENAIWHGLLHRPENGKITISMTLTENDIIRCMIEDNGVGRRRSQELKKNMVRTHKSVGMEVTRERLEIINKTSNSDLSVHVTDLYDDAGNPCGTRVIIYIPVN